MFIHWFELQMELSDSTKLNFETEEISRSYWDRYNYKYGRVVQYNKICSNCGDLIEICFTDDKDMRGKISHGLCHNCKELFLDEIRKEVENSEMG